MSFSHLVLRLSANIETGCATARPQLSQNEAMRIFQPRQGLRKIKNDPFALLSSTQAASEPPSCGTLILLEPPLIAKNHLCLGLPSPAPHPAWLPMASPAI